jgi:hypothetical protein
MKRRLRFNREICLGAQVQRQAGKFFPPLNQIMAVAQAIKTRM